MLLVQKRAPAFFPYSSDDVSKVIHYILDNLHNLNILTQKEDHIHYTLEMAFSLPHLGVF